ncbi:metal-dependent hydrolase [Desulfuromonas versatilis]|uniref:Metal-dependent hydrolase n=1 Tax=Desulfuromonas versatilis TaxID=2802975 RepID=A0ABM8HT33_9BACT|nr:amidohydrolase family protein [Desulfuromonas versatilis]BCR03612.1 metal-dependent hydrolase [Desulfuromonas versatilis]
MSYLLSLFLLCLLTLGAAIARPAKAEELGKETRPLPVIDMHAHIAGIGAGGSGCYVSPGLRDNWRYAIYLKAFGVTREELEREGDRITFEKVSGALEASREVDGAVILALDGVVNEAGELDLERTEVYIPNEFVARETARYANLHFGASVNPYRRDALARLEQAKADGAVLVKWLPAIQRIDPSDPRLAPFYLKLKELDLPLLVHTGAERSFSRADHRLGDPQLLRQPLELGVTVIAAHVATTGRTDGETDFDRLLRLFPKYPSLYADISSLTQLNKLWYLPKVLEHPEIHDRLLYGTDFPLIETGLLGVKLVSPWYFPFRLGWGQMRGISGIENPWDRDVALKQALGFGPGIFTRPASLLKIHRTGEPWHAGPGRF